MQTIKIKAFTLVELIVVITIVWILSTVWFVSYSWYLTWARDSNRISQLTKLSDSLQVYSASKTLPLPDDYIEIQASGSLVAYQGYVWVDVLETIDYTNWGKDPKDDSYYTYYLTKDRNSLQLMAMMEEQSSTTAQTIIQNLTQVIPQTKASYEDRFPKVYGRKLWILTYSDSDTSLTNTPAQSISANAVWFDIVLTDSSYTAHISNTPSDKITGTGSSLSAVNSKASCKRIKQTGWAWDNGIYTISPSWSDFQVYCDMETAWGGWTAFYWVDSLTAEVIPSTIFPWEWDYGSIWKFPWSSDLNWINFSEFLVLLDETEAFRYNLVNPENDFLPSVDAPYDVWDGNGWQDCAFVINYKTYGWVLIWLIGKNKPDNGALDVSNCSVWVWWIWNPWISYIWTNEKRDYESTVFFVK